MSRNFSEICPSCGYLCMTVEQCHRAQHQDAMNNQQPDDWWNVVAKRREWVASVDKSAPVRYVLLLRSELKPEQGIRFCFYSMADAEWLYADTDGTLREFVAYTHWTHPLAGNPIDTQPEREAVYRRISSEEHDHVWAIADTSISRPGILRPEDIGDIISALEEEGFVIFKATEEQGRRGSDV